ncbi:hypothetical protein N7492_007566 [Penicillium capsulatum]|uniref:Uncharacterized protein n=1 Tax=Penicillium capsulatum TaxID=69766 RepID=A0A9W9I1H5_9EURO|nr:hypothetical protein N7492_007566 [Penicillium capsulatum]
MTDEISRLVGEVERVVTAPYVPALQDLHDLAGNTSSFTIKYWALQKPCQVGLLVDVLVEALSRSRVALPLVTAFASSPTFRNSLLIRHPVILDVFLEKTIDAGEPEYFPACIALLSSPLPTEIVLPARFTEFIKKLVSAMADNPCADTISPLHSLMGCIQGSPWGFDEIPSEAMVNFQVEFTKILRNLDDHMGSLLCLATFARITSAQYHGPQKKHGPSTPSWLLNIQHFFSSKRGLKTLDLVVLRVILACSSSSSLTLSQAAESIRLSISIADSVDTQEKQAWLSSNSPKMAKLCEKVGRDGLDREIQMMGVAFLLSLRPAADLPSQIRELGMHLLVSKGPRGALGVMSHELIAKLARNLASSDESAIYHLLRFAFESLKDGAFPESDAFADLHLAHLLLSGFQAAQSESMNRSLLKSRSTKESLATLLGQFPNTSAQAECSESQVCHCAKAAKKNEVFVNLFDLYFAAILSRDGETGDFMVMKSFVNRAAASLTQVTCAFSKSSLADFQTSLPIRSRQDFMSNQPPARDWRSGMTDLFTKNANVLQGTMIQKIEGICFDLERRCYDIEGPLRRAEEERGRHVSEAEQLKLRNGELERQLEYSSRSVSDLQQELSRLEEEAENADSRVNELAASLDYVRQELHEQRQQSEKALQNERETARFRELDFMASATGKDDQIGELQESLRHLQSENGQVRQTLDTISKDQNSLLEAKTSLQRELAEQRGLVETSKLLCSEKEDEIQRLLADNKDMRLELASMKNTLDEQSSEVERLYLNLQECEDRFQTETEALNRKHDTETSNATSELEKQKEEISRLQDAMQVAAHDASKDLQLKQKRINQLESKIQSFRDERAAKAREFSEAQQHIGRLMNVMGFNAKSAESPAPSQNQRPCETDRTKPANTRRSVAFDEDESQLVESFESMPSNLRAPSPKRARNNRRSINASQAFPKTPTFAAPKPSTVNSGSPQPRSARRPLGDIDSNSPGKSQSTNCSKHSQPVGNLRQENQLQPFDLDRDLEFSKDFKFTSTAFSGSTDRMAPK